MWGRNELPSNCLKFTLRHHVRRDSGSQLIAFLPCLMAPRFRAKAEWKNGLPVAAAAPPSSRGILALSRASPGALALGAQV